MTLRNLEIFLAVVSCGSMRAAAEALYVSQPSVSGAVAELESECGSLLFERMGKKLYITPLGSELAERARVLLELNGELHRHICGGGGNAPLRLGATVTVGTCIMSRLCRKLGAPYPYVLVHNTRVIEQELCANRIDAALVEGEVTSPELVCTDCIPDSLALICPAGSELSQRGNITAEELSEIELISRERGSGTRDILERELRRLGLRCSIRWECNNTEAILAAVREGLGCAVISRRLVEGRDEFTCVNISELNLNRNFKLVIHKDKRVGERLSTFIELCRLWNVLEK